MIFIHSCLDWFDLKQISVGFKSWEPVRILANFQPWFQSSFTYLLFWLPVYCVFSFLKVKVNYVVHPSISPNSRLTDEYRFCCLAPSVWSCKPDPDEFSSCEDLMSNIILRISIWVMGVVAVVFNLIVMTWRISDSREGKVIWNYFYSW